MTAPLFEHGTSAQSPPLRHMPVMRLAIERTGQALRQI